MTDCGICGNRAGNRVFQAREMMFGTREEFSYLECGSCGCLELQEPPEDFSPHYPPSYYSFREPYAPPLPSRPKLAYRELRSFLLLRGINIGRLDARLRGRKAPAEPDSEFVPWPVWLVGLSPRSRILDVGCGKGQLLLDLHREGFRRLMGLDPYLSDDVSHGDGLSIHRELPPDAGPFDLIMLNHSLEHMSAHVETLGWLRRRLSTAGRILVRIPVADSYAFRHYRSHWVGLDPPRHQYVHTVKSLKLTADHAGLRVADIKHDSWSFQFWGSEQYRNGISLMDERSYFINPGHSTFSADAISQFKERARLLNRQGDGDTAGFVLVPALGAT